MTGIPITRRNALKTIAGAGTVALGVGTVSARPENTAGMVDVIPTGGQSNAVGKGDSVSSANVEAGAAFEWTGDGLTHLDDPVGGETWGVPADTGSMWPAFAREWYDQTGRRLVLVNVARGGTAQIPASTKNGAGHWSESGDWLYRLIVSVDDCMSWLVSNGYVANLRALVWCQGERDAQAIDAGAITKQAYKTGLQTMIADFQTGLRREKLPFCIVQTGQPNDGDTTGFTDVRASQTEVADEDPDTAVVTEQARTFPAQGYMKDRLHYTQTGYNTLGESAAAGVVDFLRGDTA